jgi:RNA polymerase sigma-70 factor (ECF subfamily)
MGSLRSIRSRASLPPPAPAPESSCLDSFERELDYLFGILQRFGAHPNEVEDLLQEIFVILYRHWPSLDTSRPLRPWLFGVSFRVVRSHRRRRPRETLQEGLDPEDDALDPEAHLESQQSLAILSAALQRIPAQRRKVVVLHDLEGVAVVDIARQLSITKFGVYARLYKGRKELGEAVRRLRKESVRR